MSSGIDAWLAQQVMQGADSYGDHLFGSGGQSYSYGGVNSGQESGNNVLDDERGSQSERSSVGSVSSEGDAAPRKKGPLENPLVVLGLMAVALSGVATYFVDITDSKAYKDKEYDSSMAFNIAGDAIVFAVLAVNVWQSYLLATSKGASLAKHAFMFTKPVALIHATYAIVEIEELFIGFGPPYDGADFKEGSKGFAAVHEQLKATFPDDSWQGAAAGAYSGQVAATQDGAQDMASYDHRLANLLNEQAGWVLHMRLGFGLLKFILAVAAAAASIAATLASADTLLPAVYLAQTIAVLGTTAATGMVVALKNRAAGAVSDIDTLAADYRKVVTDLASPDASAQACVPAVPGTGVASYTPQFAGLSGLPTAASAGAGMPPVAPIRPEAISAPASATPARLRPPTMFEPPRTVARPAAGGTHTPAEQPAAEAPARAARGNGTPTDQRAPIDVTVLEADRSQEDSSPRLSS